MRKIVITIGIVVVVIVLAATAFVATFNPNAYRGTLEGKLEKQLNRKVSLGNMDLGLFPMRFRVASFSIADDPKFNSTVPFIQAQELSVSVKLLPLLSKSLQVNSVTLQRPNVEFIKNAQGAWNFATLGPGSSRPSSASSPSAEGQFSLAIKDGQVAITDLQNRKPRTVYDHINLKLTDFTSNSPFNLDASVHLPGSGSQELRLQGNGGPMSHTNPAATPFKGELDLKAVQIAGLQKFLQAAALVNTDGLLSGHTNIANQNGELSASGQVNIANPRLHGIEVGYPIDLYYDLGDDLSNQLLRIRKGAIKLGPTPLEVTGTVDSKPTPAQLDLNVRANEVSIAEISRLAAAAGVAFSPGTTVNGRVNANIQARGEADKPALNGTITGHDIQITGKDIPKPVLVKAATISLTPTEIHSDNFNVTSAGTTAAVQFAMKQYTSSSPQIDATMRAPQAALPDLLSMAKAYGVTGLDKISGAGSLSLDMHAAGPLKSFSSDQIMRAVNGNIGLNFNNVRYAGMDVSHQLASLAGLQQKDQGFTNILKLVGNIPVKNGIAQTNNLQAALDVANVGATGTADLASQALNLQLTAVFSKAFTQGIGGQSIGGANVGGYMNAALTNGQGELVIPANVTGTFQNPKFLPDPKRMAQMRMKSLIPTADNPLGGASSILGGFFGQKGQPVKGQPQQQQQNPVDQIMGLFGNKKKQ